MNILLLTNAMDAGGAETHILTLAKGLCARGHTVTVASTGGSMVEALTRVGVRHLCIPLDSRRPDRLLSARRQLAHLLDNEPFDIVHAHARIPAFVVAPLTRRHRLCLVTTAHADFSATPLRRRLSRWGFATVAVSEDLAHALCVRYGMDSSQITVIRNGIDTAHFSPVRRRARSGGLRIVCMSRLDRDCATAARLLCRLAPQLHREIEGLVITIVGGGNAYCEIAREAARVRAESGAHIGVTGHVDDPRRLLHECDVFVGVSRAALEAMACGRCVILGGDEGFFGLVTEENASLAARENFCARGYGKMTEDKLYAAICEVARMGDAVRLARGVALRAYVEREQSDGCMVSETEQFYTEAQARVACGDRDVLLCGYYGYGNVGDDALLRAAIFRARERFPTRGIVALTRRGARDEWQFGIPCIRRDRPLAVMRAIRRAEVVVFGGGTLLQDATSRRSLFYYVWLLRYAQKHEIPCELWGNGIGTLTRRGSEEAVASVLSRCHYVGLRDGRSLEIAHEMMQTSPCRPVRENDLALKTASSDPSRIGYLLDKLPAARGKGRVAVAIKGGVAHGVLHAMEEWLCMLRGEGYELVFVSLYPKEDDALTQRLCSALGGVWLRGTGAGDLVGLFAHCEAVCSMRLHALVFAAAAGTPFVGFGTDEKIESFCREHGGVYYVDLYTRGTNSYL